ncbi:MAG: precorrin-4 C(11)-methyltransferase [Alphaproteobacteria bacterium]|nr:precorrin-4 C(11)-methyltransferase [Alphaproteobacteria bacterium]
MTLHPIEFVGAGPGAPDLITVRGRDLLARADVILFAGSLVPLEMLQPHTHAQQIDSAAFHLDEIIETMVHHYRLGRRVVRLHSGDPSIYGATNEQCRRLDGLGIAYNVTPGVPAFAAAAAALRTELTLPRVAQTVTLTRTATRSSEMPEGEELETLAAVAGTLVFHLSITKLAVVLRALAQHRPASTPVVVAYRVGWEDELFLHGTIDTIRPLVKQHKLTRTAMIMVGDVFATSQRADADDSALYRASHHHVFREAV